MVRMACEKFADRKCVGERRIENGEKKFIYDYITYREVYERIKNFGMGLKTIIPAVSNLIEWQTNPSARL